jgi:hypothetical protein
VINQFELNQVFSRDELRAAVHSVRPAYSENSLKWLISKLLKEAKIEKVGRSRYRRFDQAMQREQYHPVVSTALTRVQALLNKTYPLMDYQVWETTQLNEFVNHQFAHNVAVIETEKQLTASVFETLRQTNKTNTVLLLPNADTLSRYQDQSNSTIVIQNLVTEAPRPIQSTKNCCLEKILVDLFTKKLSGQLVSKSEYPAIFEDAFNKYVIDQSTMLRYARRRNCESRILEFIQTETNIVLMKGL